VLRAHLPDHRHSSESVLLEGLRSKDPLALAEVYHRTVPAAYACGRRLLGAPAEIEALLRAVYSELWERPPDGESVETWVRRRCFALAAEHLRELGRGPAAPSAAELLADLPEPTERRHDPVEELLAALDPGVRRILLEAHDRGVSTAAADDPREAALALEEALLALAGADADGEEVPDASACGGLPLGDWVLGLLAPDLAERVQQEAGARDACAVRARLLRRGRRRLEGLPPTPDMGQRILVSIAAGASSSPTPPSPEADDELPSALDTAFDDELDEEPVGTPVEQPAGGEEPDVAKADTEQWKPATADEDWTWGADERKEEAKPRRGRRVLAFLGVIVLIALGAVVGMYVGSLVVGG
jgi:DNA-directed RNA polymerase specialized sigma24 family protein